MRKISKDVIIYLRIIIVAIIIRVIFFNFVSGDYTEFLKPWVEQIRDLNGFESLKENIGNYNIPYIVILTIVSYFKCEPLIPIKIVSIVFDIICFIASYGIIFKITNNKTSSLIGSAVVMLLPTVVLNGAMWGQCDSIYCSFVLLSIYFLLDKKYMTSFVMLGIAFAFKLQTIFILPLYILMFFRDKQIKWYYFLIIPLVNFLLCLPAIIAGRNVVDIFTIYLNQTSYYNELTYNLPNSYSIINESEFAIKYSSIITLVGILITIGIFVAIWIIVLIKKINFNYENIIGFGLLSVIIATFFLPRMHDRYIYLADILSVIWYVCYRKKIYIPIIINGISVYSYITFLSAGTPKFMITGIMIAVAIIEFILICWYLVVLNKNIQPFIIYGMLLIMGVMLSSYSVYFTRIIYSVLYFGTLVSFSRYMIINAFNNGSNTNKERLCVVNK